MSIMSVDDVVLSSYPIVTKCQKLLRGRVLVSFPDPFQKNQDLLNFSERETNMHHEPEN